MEKRDLKTIEKELKEFKLYFMIQSKLQKEMLMEIKQLRRDIKNPYLPKESKLFTILKSLPILNLLFGRNKNRNSR